MQLTDLYTIDGYALPVPDQDVEMSFEDLDAADAGRDEAGFMHRHVVRQKLGVWNFSYAHFDEETMAYLRQVLHRDGTFRFTYPDPGNTGRRLTVTAYLSGYGFVWRNAKTGDYRNLKFSVIQC